MNKEESSAVDPGDGNDSGDDADDIDISNVNAGKRNLKTCTATFKQILRPDLLEDSHYQRMLMYIEPQTLTIHGPNSRILFKHRAPQLARSQNRQRPPNGLGGTIQVHIQEFAVSADNLWSGPIYAKLLDHPLRILLRLHLAPNHEQKTYKSRINAKKQKDNSDEDDPESNEGGDTASPKEPFRDKLKSMQGLLKVLLESPFLPSNVVDWEYVQQSTFVGSNFNQAQYEVIAKIMNIPRPNVPKRQINEGPGRKTKAPMAHVALRAPLVMIANAVLRSTGHIPNGPGRTTGPVYSEYEAAKREKRAGPGVVNWSQEAQLWGMSKNEISKTLDHINNRITEIEDIAKPIRKELTQKERVQSAAADKHRTVSTEGMTAEQGTETRKVAYRKLQAARADVRECHLIVEPLNRDAHRLQRERYYWVEPASPNSIKLCIDSRHGVVLFPSAEPWNN
ncbi:MAG: hypothetical protein J3Q66DRAFT_432676 [Benniella sp.]|nr:MAG: hypothetical protein J3Q66DRAFT_432676 [Benniella sp.]